MSGRIRDAKRRIYFWAHPQDGKNPEKEESMEYRELHDKYIEVCKSEAELRGKLEMYEELLAEKDIRIDDLKEVIKDLREELRPEPRSWWKW